jgi:NAD(P)H-dependent FMN reductase
VKRLLGLIGSPRKQGNSEILVKEIYRQLPGEWELQIVRPAEFDIRPCRGCYQCLFGAMTCVVKDDFPVILDALAQSDAYVAAAPAYLLSANASLKRFLDRGLSFFGHADKLWGKPAVGAVLAGLPGMEGFAKLGVDSFIKLTFAQHRGCEVVYAALPGEAVLHEEGTAAAKRLAQALIADPYEPAGDLPVSRCGLCGGDTFRFLENGKVKCMLCSGDGTFEVREGHFRVRIEPSTHPLFLSYEHAMNHLAWLQGMKDAFRARRSELKAVAEEYARDGERLRPPDAGS